MSLYRKKDSPYWHYDFQINGHRFFGSTKESSKRKAELKQAHVRSTAMEGRDGNKRHMTMNEAAGRYYEEVAKHQPSCDDTFRQLGYLLDAFGSETRLSNLSDNELSMYIARRRATVSNATVNREVELLRRVYRRAERTWKADIGEMPEWKSLLLPEPAWRIRELAPDEEDQLFGAMREDMHALVRFCIVTGARKSEARLLTWDQVDLKNEKPRVILRTKSRKPGGELHIVPLPHQFVVLLANLRSHHPERVFTYVCQKQRGPRKRGQRYPWTKSGLNSAWKRAIKASGIRDFRFHDLRHTAGSRTTRETGNLNVTKELLGHSSITMTQRYAHVTQDDVLAAMEAVLESRKTPAENATAPVNSMGNKVKSG
ncbi:MAG: site-specific integrase [Alphaproteobacteria bacterium]|nr:site-specific integrase [Alphaproteobacteria bacterium]MCZ6849573.1 site-specific integrase [Alphaproteobacteria bacterium]